jgi:hypothetical protein
MDEKLNPKDKVLLMRDEGEGNKLKVVKGIDKKGKIDAIDPHEGETNRFYQNRQARRSSRKLFQKLL